MKIYKSYDVVIGIGIGNVLLINDYYENGYSRTTTKHCTKMKRDWVHLVRVQDGILDKMIPTGTKIKWIGKSNYRVAIVKENYHG